MGDEKPYIHFPICNCNCIRICICICKYPLGNVYFSNWLGVRFQAGDEKPYIRFPICKVFVSLHVIVNLPREMFIFQTGWESGFRLGDEKPYIHFPICICICICICESPLGNVYFSNWFGVRLG